MPSCISGTGAAAADGASGTSPISTATVWVIWSTGALR